MVLDLESGGHNACVSLKVHHERSRVVRDTNRLGVAGVDERLHCTPSGVKRCLDEVDLAICIRPAGFIQQRG
jgi:hypothetical protein